MKGGILNCRLENREKKIKKNKPPTFSDLGEKKIKRA